MQLLRWTAALALVGMAAVHLELYVRAYHFLPIVGKLFVATGVVGVLLAIGWIWLPGPLARLRRLLAAGSALFAAGALAAYAYALVGTLFGELHEPYVSYSGGVAIASEVVVVVASLAWLFAGRAGPAVESTSAARSAAAPGRSARRTSAPRNASSAAPTASSRPNHRTS